MKFDYRLFIFALIQVVCLSFGARGDEIDRFVEKQIKDLRIPGASLAVVRNGKIIKTMGYGFADLQSKSPATPRTVYEIGSLTKQFTAVSVMMLVEEGRIGLDDRIAGFFPDAPAWWGQITIRHLLTHTSGIQNHVAVPGYMDLFRSSITGKTFPARDEILREFYRLPAEFPPGETWAYDNTGYILLGLIIEKVSGKDYWQFLDERIFKPLGMDSTRNTDNREIVAGRAAGYGWIGDRWENRPVLLPFVAFSAGSLMSTVEDLAKWDAALDGEKLLKKSTLEKMWTPARTSSGQISAMDYGFGWFVEKYRDQRNILHGGGTPGFSSVIHRFVDKRLSVIVLTNHADIVLDQIPLEIAGMLESSLRYRAPKVDPDPALTAGMRAAAEGYFSGNYRPELFTVPMQIHLKTSTGRSLREWYSSLGKLKSFVFLEKESFGDHFVLRYRLLLGNSFYRFSFKIVPGDKIAQIYCW